MKIFTKIKVLKNVILLVIFFVCISSCYSLKIQEKELLQQIKMRQDIVFDSCKQVDYYYLEEERRTINRFAQLKLGDLIFDSVNKYLEKTPVIVRVFTDICPYVHKNREKILPKIKKKSNFFDLAIIDTFYLIEKFDDKIIYCEYMFKKKSVFSIQNINYYKYYKDKSDYVKMQKKYLDDDLVRGKTKKYFSLFFISPELRKLIKEWKITEINQISENNFRNIIHLSSSHLFIITRIIPKTKEINVIFYYR